MGHPDFRVTGKIFATLAYPDKAWGMVTLTSKQQAMFVDAEPRVFVPAKGSWGRQGATTLLLRSATRESMRKALERRGVTKHQNVFLQEYKVRYSKFGNIWGAELEKHGVKIWEPTKHGKGNP